MNYEQKYEEALERAKKMRDSIIGSHNPESARLYVGHIENIFPELRESEDERIKKAIRLILIATEDEQKDFYSTHGLTRKDCTDWLEKLKEQKPAELPKSEDYGIDGLYAAVDILQKTLGEVDGYQTDDGILEHKCAISAVKELYEQKPAECIPDYIKFDEGFKTGREVGFREGVESVKPAEWDEEDNEVLQQVIADIEDLIAAETSPGFLAKYNKHLGWLKSLRPQPKQEWSEDGSIGKKIDKYFSEHPYLKDLYEDNPLSFDGAARFFYTEGQLAATKRIRQEQKTEQWTDDDEWMRDFITSLCVDFQSPSNCAKSSTYYNAIEEAKNWLKSLRNRPIKSDTWKPSEEQMKALERTTRLANFGLEEDRRIALVSLYEQLKAL